jgi:hypothetical protein
METQNEKSETLMRYKKNGYGYQKQKGKDHVRFLIFLSDKTG